MYRNVPASKTTVTLVNIVTYTSDQKISVRNLYQPENGCITQIKVLLCKFAKKNTTLAKLDPINCQCAAKSRLNYISSKAMMCKCRSRDTKSSVQTKIPRVKSLGQLFPTFFANLQHLHSKERSNKSKKILEQQALSFNSL